MKRYEPHFKVYWKEGAVVGMSENPNGEWVKWKDSDELLIRFQKNMSDEYGSLRELLQLLKVLWNVIVKR